MPFASCYAYCPWAGGALGEQARRCCERLKEADPRWLARFAAQVWTETRLDRRFAALFGEDVVLVPVPGSRPAHQGPWVGERLAVSLGALGLGQAVWPLLRRQVAVRKSAFARAGERPSVLEHYRSFAVDWTGNRDRSGPPPRLTLVDDVITRGRTVLGAAARLREAFPGSDIRAFALMRTLGRGEVPRRNPDPCEGQVRWVCADARRLP